MMDQRVHLDTGTLLPIDPVKSAPYIMESL